MYSYIECFIDKNNMTERVRPETRPSTTSSRYMLFANNT